MIKSYRDLIDNAEKYEHEAEEVVTVKNEISELKEKYPLSSEYYKNDEGYKSLQELYSSLRKEKQKAFYDYLVGFANACEIDISKVKNGCELCNAIMEWFHSLTKN